MATTTPNYGWTVPTSTDYVADGAVAIETLGDSVDSTLFTALGGAYPGMRLVKKQTIGTGVSSVIVTDAFSAAYENYRVIISGGVASGATYTLLQLRTGSTTATTGYYRAMWYVDYAASSGAQAATNTSSWRAGYATANSFSGTIDILSPFLAVNTTMTSSASGALPNEAIYMHGGYHTAATSYDQFVLSTTAGTLTGGTIYVYGYGAS
jgi:hypothetical protein